MAVVIVLQRRSPAATIAWMLVLAFLPIVGYVVYRLIGPQRLERKKLRRQLTRKLIEEAAGALHAIEVDAERIASSSRGSAIAAGEPPPLRADGDRALLRRPELLRRDRDRRSMLAKHHVHLEYYIWENDQIGRRLRDQLIERAKAASRSGCIVDGTGSHGAGTRFFKPLVAAGARGRLVQPGVAVHAAPPPRGLSLASQDRRVRRQRRLHRRHEHRRRADARVHRRRRLARHPRAVRRLDGARAAADLRRGLGVLRRPSAAVRATVLPDPRRATTGDVVQIVSLGPGPRRVRDPQDVLRRDQPGGPARVADDAVLRPRRGDPLARSSRPRCAASMSA